MLSSEEELALDKIALQEILLKDLSPAQQSFMSRMLELALDEEGLGSVYPRALSIASSLLTDEVQNLTAIQVKQIAITATERLTSKYIEDKLLEIGFAKVMRAYTAIISDHLGTYSFPDVLTTWQDPDIFGKTGKGHGNLQREIVTIDQEDGEDLKSNSDYSIIEWDEPFLGEVWQVLKDTDTPTDQIDPTILNYQNSEPLIVHLIKGVGIALKQAGKDPKFIEEFTKALASPFPKAEKILFPEKVPAQTTAAREQIAEKDNLEMFQTADLMENLRAIEHYAVERNNERIIKFCGTFAGICNDFGEGFTRSLALKIRKKIEALNEQVAEAEGYNFIRLETARKLIKLASPETRSQTAIDSVYSYYAATFESFGEAESLVMMLATWATGKKRLGNTAFKIVSSTGPEISDDSQTLSAEQLAKNKDSIAIYNIEEPLWRFWIDQARKILDKEFDIKLVLSKGRMPATSVAEILIVSMAEELNNRNVDPEYIVKNCLRMASAFHALNRNDIVDKVAAAADLRFEPSQSTESNLTGSEALEEVNTEIPFNSYALEAAKQLEGSVVRRIFKDHPEPKIKAGMNLLRGEVNKLTSLINSHTEQDFGDLIFSNEILRTAEYLYMGRERFPTQDEVKKAAAKEAIKALINSTPEDLNEEAATKFAQLKEIWTTIPGLMVAVFGDANKIREVHDKIEANYNEPNDYNNALVKKAVHDLLRKNGIEVEEIILPPRPTPAPKPVIIPTSTIVLPEPLIPEPTPEPEPEFVEAIEVIEATTVPKAEIEELLPEESVALEPAINTNIPAPTSSSLKSGSAISNNGKRAALEKVAIDKLADQALDWCLKNLPEYYRLYCSVDSENYGIYFYLYNDAGEKVELTLKEHVSIFNNGGMEISKDNLTRIRMAVRSFLFSEDKIEPYRVVHKNGRQTDINPNEVIPMLSSFAEAEDDKIRILSKQGVAYLFITAPDKVEGKQWNFGFSLGVEVDKLEEVASRKAIAIRQLEIIANKGLWLTKAELSERIHRQIVDIEGLDWHVHDRASLNDNRFSKERLIGTNILKQSIYLSVPTLIYRDNSWYLDFEVKLKAADGSVQMRHRDMNLYTSDINLAQRRAVQSLDETEFEGKTYPGLVQRLQTTCDRYKEQSWRCYKASNINRIAFNGPDSEIDNLFAKMIRYEDDISVSYSYTTQDDKLVLKLKLMRAVTPPLQGGVMASPENLMIPGKQLGRKIPVEVNIDLPADTELCKLSELAEEIGRLTKSKISRHYHAVAVPFTDKEASIKEVPTYDTTLIVNRFLSSIRDVSANMGIDVRVPSSAAEYTKNQGLMQKS